MLALKVEVFPLQGGLSLATWHETIGVITLEAAQHFVAEDWSNCNVVITHQKLGSLMQVRTRPITDLKAQRRQTNDHCV